MSFSPSHTHIHCNDWSFNLLYYSSEIILPHRRAVCACEKTEGTMKKRRLHGERIIGRGQQSETSWSQRDRKESEQKRCF